MTTEPDVVEVEEEEVTEEVASEEETEDYEDGE